MAARTSLVLEFLTDVKGINQGVKQVNSRLDSVGKMATRLGGVLAAAFAADKIKDFTVAAFKLGDTAVEVRKAFDGLAGTSLRSLRAATQGAVDDLTLMQKAVSANNLGIPVENLATLFEFASKRAAQTGENVEHLVDSIVTGIGRKSSLVLDNLGIVMSTAGKTTREVSDEVLNLANNSLAQMGSVGVSSVEKLNAAYANFQLAIGEFMQGPGAAFLTWVTEVLNKLTLAFSRNARLMNAESIKEVEKAIEEATTDYQQLTNAMRDSSLRTKENQQTLSEKAQVITDLKARLRELTGETALTDTTTASYTGTVNTNTAALTTNAVAANTATASMQQLGTTITSVSSGPMAAWDMQVLKNRGSIELTNLTWADYIRNIAKMRASVQGLTVDFSNMTTATTTANTGVGALGNTLAQVATQAIGVLSNIASGGKVSGGGIGSLIGGILGTIVGGPVGAAIGSGLGGLIGGLFGRKRNRDANNITRGETLPSNWTPYDESIHGGIGSQGIDRGRVTATINMQNSFVGSEEQLANEISRLLDRNTQSTNFAP